MATTVHMFNFRQILLLKFDFLYNNTMVEYQTYKLIFDYSEFSKSPRFLHSYSSQVSAETDKYIGDFAKLRVIEGVAYDFKTLSTYSIFISFQAKHGMENGKEMKLQPKFWLCVNVLLEFQEISMMNIQN